MRKSLNKIKKEIRRMEVLIDYTQIKLSAAKDKFKENQYCYDGQFEIKSLQNELDSQLNELETLYGFFAFHYKENEQGGIVHNVYG